MNEPLQQHGINIEDGQDGLAEDLAKSESDRIKTFYQTILSVLVVFILAALSGYKDIKELYSTTNHKRVHLSNLLVAEGLLLTMTFLCAVVLVMLEFFVYQCGRRSRSRRVWYRFVTILITVTGVMLIMTNMVLVIVTNRNNTALSVVLAPVLVLVIVAVRAAWMEEDPSPSTTLGTRYDEATKGTFDMATIGTGISFALQGTIAFGYLQTPGNNHGKDDPPLDLAVSYAISTFSLIMMMICAMPLALLPANVLEDLIRIVETLRHVVLAALAMMALVVSVEFLEGFVVLPICLEAVALVLYYTVVFFPLNARAERTPPQDFAFRIVAAVGFTLMTGLYAAFLGTDGYSVYLKAAMFVLLLAVLSSLSRLAVPLQVCVGRAGAVVMGIAGVVVALPAAALLAAIPLVVKVFLDLYLNR